LELSHAVGSIQKSQFLASYALLSPLNKVLEPSIADGKPQKSVFMQLFGVRKPQNSVLAKTYAVRKLPNKVLELSHAVRSGKNVESLNPTARALQIKSFLKSTE
jgi:hypothetical protein